MDSLYLLVNVWVKSRNVCGNNYESQGFVNGLKKDLWMLFLANLGEVKKKGSMSMWAKF